MSKVILFDFWGTLVENGVWSPAKQIQHTLRINLHFSDYIIRMERAMMTSSFASLTDAFSQVCLEFEIPPTPRDVDYLVGMWNKSWMLAKPYEEVFEVLQDLKRTHSLVLISNTDNFSINRVLEKYNLACYFDKMFFSYDVGLIKTDPEFLSHVMTTLNVLPEDCLLVGDSIQSDIEPAKAAGLKTLLIDRKNKRQVDEKIINLREIKEYL